jgi:hypothetical protein
MNRILRYGLAGFLVVCSVANAGAPTKTTFQGFGVGFDIPPFDSGCISTFPGSNFAAGESTNSPGRQFAQFNFYGQNTCTGETFYASIISDFGGSVSINIGPARNSLSGSGSIPFDLTTSTAIGQIDFTVSAAATREQGYHSWGTNNYDAANVRIVTTFDETGKPAYATLTLTGFIAGAAFSATFNAVPTQIGDTKTTTTTLQK